MRSDREFIGATGPGARLDADRPRAQKFLTRRKIFCAPRTPSHRPRRFHRLARKSSIDGNAILSGTSIRDTNDS